MTTSSRSTPPRISAARRDLVLSSAHACVGWGHAVLTASPASDGDDRRFILSGRSGRHTLLVAATDAARLDAHWQVFCQHDLNAEFPDAA